MKNLEHQTSVTLERMERYERNWHLVKALLLLIGIATIITIQILTFHRLLDNSNTNRQLLRCAVAGFNSENPVSVNKCLEENK